MMNFIAEVCTDELFEKLKLPESLKKIKSENPIGRTIYFNLDQRIALIAHAIDHTCWPNLFYHLCIDGRCLNVFERHEGIDNPIDYIAVGISSNTTDLDDDFIKSITTQAFATRSPSGKCPYDVRISGREVPPEISPRQPSEIVSFLNKLVIELDGPNDFAVRSFVPFCVRRDEFDNFMSHLEKTKWSTLSLQSKELVEQALTHRRDQ